MRWVSCCIFVALFSVGVFDVYAGTDYIIEDNILYWILPDLLSHDVAEEKCASQGMTLVSVQSLKEQIRLQKYMGWFRMKQLWTSGNDTKETGCFTWNTHRKIHGVFTQWAGKSDPTRKFLNLTSPHSRFYSGYGRNDKLVNPIVEYNFVAIDEKLGYGWVTRPSESLYSAICELEMDNFEHILKSFIENSMKNESDSSKTSNKKSGW